MTHDPDRATLVIEVDPGPRARILDVRITQVDATERSTITELPDIRQGETYDETEIGRELQAWETRMRSRGYYEARANQNASISDDGSVFLFMNLELGPMVRLVFEGDPLPADERRSARAGAPRSVGRRGSARGLERMIESYLHAQGYRDAMAMYTREERAGELIITFRITAWTALSRAQRHADRQLRPPDAAAAAAGPSEGRRAVRPLDAGDGRQRHREHLSRVRVSRAPRTKATESVVAPEDPSRPGPARQPDDHDCRGPAHRSPVGHLPGQQGVDRRGAAQAHRRTAPGRVYSIVEVVDDRDAIEQAYHDRGFEGVVVTPQPTFAENDTRADVRFTIVEGPQIIVDHVIIAGNRRISTETIEREIAASSRRAARRSGGGAEPHQPRSRSSCSGASRSRRWHTPARRGATSSCRSRSRLDDRGPLRRRRGWLFAAADRRGRSGRGALRGRAAWIDSGGAAQSLGQEPDDYAVHAREPAHTRRAADAIQLNPPETIESSYGFHEYRVLGVVPGAACLSHDGRDSRDRHRRAGDPSELQLRPPGRAGAGGQPSVGRSIPSAARYSFQRTRLFDIRASPDEDAWLIDRLFPQVRISKFSGTILRDSRDPAEALDPSRGTQVIVDGRSRGARDRVGGRLRQDLPPGLLLSSAAGAAADRAGARRPRRAGARLQP